MSWRDANPADFDDEYMNEQLATTREYTAMLLHATAITGAPESAAMIREHGRRNFALRADGVLAIVCPVVDGSELCGLAIFDAPIDAVAEIMDGDPAVQAGIFTYELHPVRSFPGDLLPG